MCFLTFYFSLLCRVHDTSRRAARYVSPIGVFFCRYLFDVLPRTRRAVLHATTLIGAVFCLFVLLFCFAARTRRVTPRRASLRAAAG